jgi:hypothetical protein
LGLVVYCFNGLFYLLVVFSLNFDSPFFAISSRFRILLLFALRLAVCHLPSPFYFSTSCDHTDAFLHYYLGRATNTYAYTIHLSIPSGAIPFKLAQYLIHSLTHTLIHSYTHLPSYILILFPSPIPPSPVLRLLLLSPFFPDFFSSSYIFISLAPSLPFPGEERKKSQGSSGGGAIGYSSVFLLSGFPLFPLSVVMKPWLPTYIVGTFWMTYSNEYLRNFSSVFYLWS